MRLMLVCCHRRRWLCLLDNVLHDLHITVRPLCDWHDRTITQWYEEETWMC